ncbi:UNVERIFIED_CONTAM: hypothetical protein Scaly_2891400 [Sesamum calycinum]|uniref:DDE Tnp4 domain-containing protein n=1 Tax=Sesamum calycinum TaxID=2727403 RepID=A0AAW2L6X9_9LAMI
MVRRPRIALELWTTRWYAWHGPVVHQNRYRSGKGDLAQNVLAICDFDMNFTYVYAGWEGSAVDARVQDHAVSQDRTFLFLQLGQGRPYGTLQDMFNHAHSRLRNVIERGFGLLKNVFQYYSRGCPATF